MEGFCECGCGERTKRLDRNSPRENYKKGEYRRFIQGHQNKRFRKKYSTIPGIGNAVYHGYVYVRVPNDYPHAQSGRYAKRCRVVMESIIGRYLIPQELIHHKDGDRTNDDPGNLEIVSRVEHNRIHKTKERP
jgi:hypothetical protein